MEHKYEIKMGNDDVAYSDSIAGAMLAAKTMNEDAGGRQLVVSVKLNDKHSMWATAACRHHVEEQES